MSVGPVNVGSVEAVWLVLTLSGLAVTAAALVDAIRDALAITHLNGDVRSISARGSVRREVVRLLIQILLLTWVIPELFLDREVKLTPFVASLMAMPILQLVNTGSDYIDRRRIARKLLSDMIARRLGTAQ